MARPITLEVGDRVAIQWMFGRATHTYDVRLNPINGRVFLMRADGYYSYWHDRVFTAGALLQEIHKDHGLIVRNYLIMKKMPK
ncbi:hypothetical protein [Bacillus mycoides]|uniref:Uncharacterized protein n=1 Tax=Bacillus mycoides (strain KBAB4) TaxID=315730 RepID=A9VVM6_BACMK|nr:hypothetical protein [Bacillus mycoides]ABY46841.1 hypothetical protein BcerKBAB4_5347 [Bacillus mycoides KBAB4]